MFESGREEGRESGIQKEYREMDIERKQCARETMKGVERRGGC